MLNVFLIMLLLSDSQTTQQDSNRLSETLEACKMDSFYTIQRNYENVRKNIFLPLKSGKTSEQN